MARTLLVDARGAERFEGRSETIDKVAGHIPGARNHFYKWNLARRRHDAARPTTCARASTALLDGRAPADAVMYCGSGVSACHNLLAMEHAGLPGSAALPGLVVRMVGRPVAADRDRPGPPKDDDRPTTDDDVPRP